MILPGILNHHTQSVLDSRNGASHGCGSFWFVTEKKDLGSPIFLHFMVVWSWNVIRSRSQRITTTWRSVSVVPNASSALCCCLYVSASVLSLVEVDFAWTTSAIEAKTRNYVRSQVPLCQVVWESFLCSLPKLFCYLSLFLEHVSLGALGDSFYEYLLKSWIQTNKADTVAREHFDKAAEVCSCASKYSWCIVLYDVVAHWSLHHDAMFWLYGK